MLKSTMQIWDKKGETYYLANVDPKVRKTLQSMIPNIPTIMQRSVLPSTDTTMSFGKKLFNENELFTNPKFTFIQMENFLYQKYRSLNGTIPSCDTGKE